MALARAVYASELAGLAGLNQYRSQIESAATWWAREARSTRPCPVTRAVVGSGIQVWHPQVAATPAHVPPTLGPA